jgi:hypothetical protein
MKKFLGTIPLFVVAIPLFFVLHGYVQNFGYIAAGPVLLLALIYSAGALLLFGLLLLPYKRRSKAAIAAGFLLCIYFFFGAGYDFLTAHVRSLARYGIVLSALGIFVIGLLIGLKRTKRNLGGWQLFFNLLFLIYLGIDLSGLLMRSLQNDRDNTPVLAQQKMGFVPFSDSAKPDIYLLVFDAYASSLALKEEFHFDNGEFDQFLTREGFHILRHSHSNYKFTFFSMPSILNMSFVPGLDIQRSPLELSKYLTGLIRENQLMDFLHQQGYEIVNCSSFDLHGNPSPVNGSLLPIKTRLITEQTLYSRVIRDLGFHFLSYISIPMFEKTLYQSLDNDNKLIALLEAASSRKGKPRFIYGHFNFPHPPYYYGKQGLKKRVTTFYSGTDEDHAQDYLDYLYYTNKRAEEIVSTIKKNTRGNAIIVLMGDHGLRYHYMMPGTYPYQVENQNAVYFPSKDYHLFYDSISGVNEFRVVLNSAFGQHLPLLKDSTVDLK